MVCDGKKRMTHHEHTIVRQFIVAPSVREKRITTAATIRTPNFLPQSTSCPEEAPFYRFSLRCQLLILQSNEICPHPISDHCFAPFHLHYRQFARHVGLGRTSLLKPIFTPLRADHYSHPHRISCNLNDGRSCFVPPFF